MSNKSPIGRIEVPSSGGAISGLGETFKPELFTGTGNYNVPIEVPKGRNGLQPELSLAYSTGNGNSPFGLGWALSVPGVTRKTSKGVPQYQGDDVFVLSGAEDLVRVEDVDGCAAYRPRTEGLFAEILHHEGANDYWEVRTKSGLISYYGGTPQSGRFAVLSDPDRDGRIFSWRLVETRDTFGNRIVYEYELDTGENGPHRWSQLYLTHIRYVDYGDPTDNDFLVSVDFDYDEARPDPFSEYRAGFEIRTHRRCSAIVVHTHAPQQRKVRSYLLTYADQRLSTDDDFPLPRLTQADLPINGTSLLSVLQVVGYDEGAQPPFPAQQALPPLEFDYTRFAPEARTFEPIAKETLPGPSLTHPDFELVDFLGNGLPDIVQLNGVARYWKNLGDGRFSFQREMAEAPSGVRLADPDVQFMDTDGDGLVDLVDLSGARGGSYFPIDKRGGWRAPERLRMVPSFSVADANVQMVDLTGDGLTDIVRSGVGLECYFNVPGEGWSEPKFVARKHDLDEFPDVYFSDPRVHWADMTGEGLTDIVFVQGRRVEYWPNLGRGQWGKQASL